MPSRRAPRAFAVPADAVLLQPNPTPATLAWAGSHPPPPPQREAFGWPYTSGGGGYPPPPKTKVTIVRKNEIYDLENRVGTFLVHKLLGRAVVEGGGAGVHEKGRDLRGGPRSR